MKFKLTQSLLWPIVVLIIAFGAFYLKPWQANVADTISVSASGKTEVSPNVAKITATVTTNNDNLDLARKQNEEKVNKLISALTDLGIAEKDIKTQSISAGETFEIQGSEPGRPDNLPDSSQVQIYPPPPRKTKGVSTTFEITIRNFTKADEAITALTRNGASQIYGPNLTIDDQKLEDAKSSARKNAVENAKKKAQDLAGELNKKVGDAKKISEQGDFGIPVPLIARSEADLEQKASSIQPGQNEVTVSIQVEFELK